MQRATRSAAPSANAALNGNGSAPTKVPSKRGRKPKLAHSSEPTEGAKQEDEVNDQHVPEHTPQISSSGSQQQSSHNAEIRLEHHIIQGDENEVLVLMSPEEAQMVLELLEKVDADGLLDQPVNVAASVFSQSSSDQHEVSSSLRSLLEQSNDVSLRHIHRASQNFIKSVAPKSRRKTAVSERTKKFCDLLNQSLLQLIQSKGAVSGRRTDLEVVGKELSPASGDRYYALFQQLGPAGTYFSSAAKLSKEEVANLAVGQAETVAVVASQALQPSELPALSSLVQQRSSKPRPAESLPVVKRLPYDPFASFSPSYATDAALVDPYESLLAHQSAVSFRRWEKRHWPAFRLVREVKPAPRGRKSRTGKVDRDTIKIQKRQREAADDGNERLKRRKLEEDTDDCREALSLSETTTSDVAISLPSVSMSLPVDPALLDNSLLQEVDSVLGEDVIEIDQLLDDNARALQLLRALQDSRLRTDSKLSDDSVEMQLAMAVQANLSALVDWQPRSSSNSGRPVVVPRLAALNKLGKALPLEPVSGYRGILRPNSTALKDNSTVRISANASPDSYTAGQTAYGSPSASQQRYVPRLNGYTPAAAATYQYSAGQYGSLQMGGPGYASYPSTASTAYAANGQPYATIVYAGFGASAQSYANFAGYPYGVGTASWPSATYASTTQNGTRVSAPAPASSQGWMYSGQTPAVALPPHMRTTAGRTSSSPIPPTQQFPLYPKT